MFFNKIFFIVCLVLAVGSLGYGLTMKLGSKDKMYSDDEKGGGSGGGSGGGGFTPQ